MKIPFSALGLIYLFGPFHPRNGQGQIEHIFATLRMDKRKCLGIEFPVFLLHEAPIIREPGAAAGGVLGAVPGAIGAIQACEALKVLGRFGRPLSGRMLVVNFSDNLYNIISF